MNTLHDIELNACSAWWVKTRQRFSEICTTRGSQWTDTGSGKSGFGQGGKRRLPPEYHATLPMVMKTYQTIYFEEGVRNLEQQRRVLYPSSLLLLAALRCVLALM